jgi:integrase
VTAVLGLRIGEVLALRVSDIDFRRKILRKLFFTPKDFEEGALYSLRD